MSSPASVGTSPRSPAATSAVTFKPQIPPLRIRGPKTLARPIVANGQITVFPSAGEDSPATALAALPEQHDITFPTPQKDADNMALEYDHLEESEETASFQQASKALSSLTNRFQDGSSPTSHSKVIVPPLNLDKLADKAMQTRQASAQLSRPHKQNHLAIEDKENSAKIC